MKMPALQFYPADWKGSKWVKIDGGEIARPRFPCCYVVYIDDVLSYIGQTKDLAVRLSSHGIHQSYSDNICSKWGTFRSIVIKARFGEKMGDWAMREMRLIHRLQPPLNCIGSSKKRSAA